MMWGNDGGGTITIPNIYTVSQVSGFLAQTYDSLNLYLVIS